MNIINLDLQRQRQADPEAARRLESALTYLCREAQKLGLDEAAHFIGCGLVSLREQTGREAN